MKTLAEVESYLNSIVGLKLECPNNRSLDGQCVTEIKCLMQFLGCPDPWKARGNARDVGDNYLRDGICENRQGQLNVCVNRDYANGYGHVWIDINGVGNWESNGAKALTVTKNTRPISEAQQIITLDKWLSVKTMATPNWNTKSIPYGCTPENGTFTASCVRNIRRSPSLNGEIISTLFTAGASQRYDCKIAADGWMWVSWVGASGNRNYTAVRRLSDNKRYGRCY